MASRNTSLSTAQKLSLFIFYCRKDGA